MLSAEKLTHLLIKYAAFIMQRGIRVGHRGGDLLDFVQQVALELWRGRHNWPMDVKSEMALIRTHADATAIDMLRNRTALKRSAPTISLSRDNGSDPANTKGYSALHVLPNQEEVFDLALIRHAICVVAATLSPELERIVIARMNNDGGEAYSKNENQRALRAFRRALSIPSENPQGAGVPDPADHLIRTAQRIDATAGIQAARATVATTREITCANDTWMNSRESGSLRSRERHAMSGCGPSPNRTLWSATAAAINGSRSCESTPSPRSLLPLSGSAPSRRQAPSGSTTTSSSQRGARRAEPTLMTRHAMFEEDSSLSGSRA